VSILRLAGRRVWGHPGRSVQLLLRFARTEAGGAADIAAAAASAASPSLCAHLARHAEDEGRHARLLRERARDLGAADARADGAPAAVGPDLLPSASERETGRLSLTDHGFLPSARFRDYGELRYVAMLHVAERRAAAEFRDHCAAAAARDPATAAVLRAILRDEEYHVAYTRAQLRTWAAQGRAAEVRRALREMRLLRARLRLLQAARLVADATGRALLAAVYATVFLPFAMASRGLRARDGWRAPARQPDRSLGDARQPT
jgi:ferritin-like protein